jgi:uncharacterized protein YkwD
MKLRFGLIISFLGTLLWSGAMYTLNTVTSEATERKQVVAGAQTVRTISHVPPEIASLIFAINDYRSKNDINGVTQDARLDKIALERLIEMKQHRYYAHTTIDGGSFADSFISVGIPKTTYACENLLLTNASSVHDYVDEWAASTAHADCMQDDLMTRVGVAEALFDESTGQRIIVTIYAQGI